MKRQFAPIVVLLAVILNQSYCQEKSSQEIDVKNSLMKGKWAMQFEVGIDFTLKSFDGMLFSLKYQLSKRSAIRLGAGVSTLSRDITLEDTAFSYPGKQNDLGLSVVGYYLFYPSPASPINVFVGIGPRASYIHSNFEVVEDEPPNYNITDKYNTLSAGLTGLLGAEWFATTDISFFGEYSFYALYSKTKDEYEITNPSGGLVRSEKRTLEDFKFQGNTARLGISVYFDFPF
jgi:hypothetical protein